MGQAMEHSNNTGWGLVGDMTKGAIVGAASGAAGAIVGGAAGVILGNATTIGGQIVNTTIIGSVGSSASGFVSAASNAWLNGIGFKQGLYAGLKGSISSIYGGAVSGCIFGTIQAFQNYASYKSSFTAPSISENGPAVNSDGTVNYNTESAYEYWNFWNFSKSLRNLYTNGEGVFQDNSGYIKYGEVSGTYSGNMGR